MGPFEISTSPTQLGFRVTILIHTLVNDRGLLHSQSGGLSVAAGELRLEDSGLCAPLISLPGGSLLTSVASIPEQGDCFRLDSTKAYIKQSMKPRSGDLTSQAQRYFDQWEK